MSAQDTNTINVVIKGDSSALVKELQAGGQASSKFEKDVTSSLGNVNDSTVNLHRSMAMLGSQMGVALTAGLAVNKVLDFRSAIQDAQVTIDKLRNTITYGMGGYAVAQEIDYLRKATNTMGLEFSSTAQLYAKFSAAARGTALEGKGVKDVFEAVGKASTVMGLSANDVQGVMLALTQIMSKGTVQSEEIRGQLGERLPGAFQIASRAMGLTTAEFGKLLETGQVISADFLPKFAAQMEKEFAGSFEKAATSAQASLNRLTSSWELFKIAIAEDAGVGKGIASVNDMLADSFTGIAQAMSEAKKNGGGTFSVLWAAQQQAFSGLGSYKTQIASLTEKIDESNKKLVELDASIEKTPNNNWAITAAHHMRKLVAEMQAAKDTLETLQNGQKDSSPGNVSSISADYHTRSQSYGLEAERINKIRAAMASVQTELSGQNANFQKHLSALKAGFDAGLVNQADYVKSVELLIKKEGVAHESGADHLKTISSAKYAVFKATQEAITAVVSYEIAQQTRLNELAYKGGAVDVETYHQRKAELELLAIDRKQTMLQQELEEARRAEASVKKVEDKYRAQERVLKIEAQLIELGVQRAKVDGPDDAAIRGWQRLATAAQTFDAETKAVNSTLYNQQKSLTESIEDDKLRLQYQWDIQGSLKTELGLIDLKIARQKKVLEQKLYESTLTDAEKDKLRALLDESGDQMRTMANNNYIKGILDSVDQTAHSVWTNVLQGGQDAFTKIGNTLKSAVLDLLYQMTVKKWILSVGASVSGSGTAAQGAGGAGSSGISSLSNIASAGAQYFAGASVGASGASLVAANATGALGGDALGTLIAANGGWAGVSATGGAAAGAGAMATLGAAMPYIAAGLLVYSLMSSGGTTPSIEGGYSSAGDPGTNGKSYVNGFYGGAMDSGSKSIVEGMTKSYTDTVKLLGGKAGTFTASQFTGVDQNGHQSAVDMSAFVNGKAVYNRFADLGTNKVGSSDAEIKAAVDLSSKKALIEALKATDIGPVLNDYLAGIKTQGLEIAQIDAILSDATSIGTFQKSLKGLPFERLSALSVVATKDLADLAGGLDNLSANLNSYYQEFYSDGERTAITTKQITSSLGELGLAMPATRDEFRKLVDAQDLSTEAGRKNYAALMSVAGAFAGITPAATEAAAAVTATAVAMRSAADIASEAANLQKQYWQAIGDTNSLRAAELAKLDSSNRAIQQRIWLMQDEVANASKAKAAVDRAVSAQKSLLQTSVDVATQNATSIRGVFDLLKSNVASLYGQVSSVSAMSAIQGRAIISQALATAKATGYLPDQTALSDAITAARSSQSGYASKFAADKDRLQLAAELDALKDLTGGQLSTAEDQLRIAKSQLTALDEMVSATQKQIDVLNGIDTSVISLGDALANWLGASKVAKSVTASAGSAPAAAWGGSSVTVGPSDGSVYTYNPADFGGLSAEEYRRVLKGLMPSYDVGTPYVPSDQIARLHEGEAVIPKVFNPFNGKYSARGADSADVAAELRQLRDEQRAQSKAFVDYQRRIQRLFDTWDIKGMPPVRTV